jgi:hypothetical protein
MHTQIITINISSNRHAFERFNKLIKDTLISIKFSKNLFSRVFTFNEAMIDISAPLACLTSDNDFDMSMALFSLSKKTNVRYGNF